VLIKRDVLDEIKAGRVDLAFRRWRRPSVKTGGMLRTAVGTLAIDAVDVVDVDAITQREAERAGFASRDSLIAALNARSDGSVYRVRLHYQGADERIALREDAELSEAEIEQIASKLGRLDRASKHGPWTRSYLEMISDRPAVRAPDLAASVGRETAPFKTDVRKLKNLGLTESLEVGYRISPRGKAFLAAEARQ
jgi:hypothetical protein